MDKVKFNQEQTNSPGVAGFVVGLVVAAALSALAWVFNTLLALGVAWLIFGVLFPVAA